MVGAGVGVAVTGVVWAVVRSVVVSVLMSVVVAGVGTVVASSWFSEAENMHIIRTCIFCIENCKLRPDRMRSAVEYLRSGCCLCRSQTLLAPPPGGLRSTAALPPFHQHAD